jgi:hypothetical protein
VRFSSFPPSDLSRRDAREKSESARTRSGRYIPYRRHNRQNPTKEDAGLGMQGEWGK